MSLRRRQEENLWNGENRLTQAGLMPPVLARHGRRSATGQPCHPPGAPEAERLGPCLPPAPSTRDPAASSHPSNDMHMAPSTTLALPSPNTQRSRAARAHPCQPTAPGASAGPPPPAFCHHHRGGMQQCCEGRLPAAAPASKAATHNSTLRMAMSSTEA